jgi:flagellar basal-body rod protein FlgB
MNDSIQLLSKLLDVTAVRHRVLANNLANVDTPRFKRQDVQFRDALAKAIKSSDESKVADVQPRVTEDAATPGRPDGNNVTTQRELGEMMENALLYQFATKAINLKFNSLTKAIKGR